MLEQGGELDNLRDSCSLVRTHLQKPLINPFWKLPRDLHTNCFHVRRLYSIFDRISTVTYWVMEFRWGNRSCAERSGLAWLSGGVWKLAKIRKKIENGRCPLCLGEQGVKHTSLSGPETWKWKSLDQSTWNVKEKEAFEKTLTCINETLNMYLNTSVGTLIMATTSIYLQLIQNRYMFRSFTLLQCSHQHCVQPVASDVKVVGYL